MWEVWKEHSKKIFFFKDFKAFYLASKKTKNLCDILRIFIKVFPSGGIFVRFSSSQIFKWKTTWRIVMQHLRNNQTVWFRIQSSVSFASRKRKTNWYLLLPCTDIKETSARDEKPTWCLPAPFCIQLWCIRRGTKLSEKPANLPCLNELQHFQAYIFHWLE